MTAPACRECGQPVTEPSWTTNYRQARQKDEVCMACRRKRGKTNAMKSIARRLRDERREAKR